VVATLRSVDKITKMKPFIRKVIEQFLPEELLIPLRKVALDEILK